MSMGGVLRMSSRRERNEKLEVWTNQGLYMCPKCSNRNITHLTIHDEGEKLLCKNCNYSEIVGGEFMINKKGFSLES